TLNNRLMARYLAGECSRTERMQIKNWITSDPNNRELMNEYKEIWESSEKEKGPAEVLFDAEEDWPQLRSKIDQDYRELNMPLLSGQHQGRVRSTNLRRRFVPFIRVAAIILVTSLASVLA